MIVNNNIIKKLQDITEKELEFFEHIKSNENEELKRMECKPIQKCNECIVQKSKQFIYFNNWSIYGSACYQAYRIVLEHIEYLKAKTLSEKL